ncbi:uncharacterized protein [Littorina saxatilis]|uniref:uncharacterized protein n=1 Tax=Littorina saxatilis TaxID=31220 RepID=UPI0038B54B6B
MASMSSSSPDRQGGHWFPSWFIWPLFVLTSSFRVYYVTQPRNWWLVHPDEIYQTMEVAHSEVYGFGIRAYEFNPEPAIDAQTPEIRKQEMTHGMYALRSHLLPHAYVTVTWFPNCFTWKIFHTLVASTLILAVYRYVIVVFRSRDVACLAAILCAACAQLHVLGTHTLVNSLIAPPVFLVIAHLHTLINPPETDSGTDSGDVSDDEGKSNIKPNGSATKNGGSVHRGSSFKNKGKTKQHKNGTVQRDNSSLPSKSGTQNGIHGTCSAARDLQASNGHVENNNNNITVAKNGTTKISANANGHANGHVSHLPNGQVGVSQSGKAGDVTHSLTTRNCSELTKNTVQNLAVGFLLGLCVYIRIDVIALAGACLITHWSPWRTRYFDVISCACGALCGVGVGILEDFRIYGWGVLTPVNWFRFNVQKDYSSALFGTQELYKYIVDIFLHNLGIAALMSMALLCCMFHISYFSKTPKHSKAPSPKEGQNATRLFDLQKRNVVLRTCVSWFLLLILYSSKGHKELRFVHNVIVLVLITCAAVFQSALVKSRLPFDKQRLLLAVGVVLFALSQWRDVASLTDNPKRGGNKMAFKLAGDTQDVNQCLHRISARSDVTGVFIDRNLYATGGYTLLHRDVPIFSIFGYNFHEYNVESRMTEPTKTVMTSHTHMTLAYVGKFSNFVSQQNTQSVIRYVLEDPRYNYLVVMSNRDFSYFGVGHPIFTCGTFKVYKRPNKPTAEQAVLLQRAANVPALHNASVLTHEADMLYFHGAWARAVERFRLVLRVDPSQIGVYLPLAASLYRQGKESGSIKVMNECFSKFGQVACETRRPLMTDTRALFD